MFFQTFSYWQVENLLPVNTNFSMELGIEGPANCTLCDRHPETNFHLFSDCSYINMYWAALGRITGWDFQDQEIISLEFSNPIIHKEAKIILVVFATHIIWKERNEIKHNPGTRVPNFLSIVRKVWGKIKGRLKYERRHPNAPLTVQLDLLDSNFQYFFENARNSLPI